MALPTLFQGKNVVKFSFLISLKYSLMISFKSSATELTSDTKNPPNPTSHTPLIPLIKTFLLSALLSKKYQDDHNEQLIFFSPQMRTPFIFT